MQHFEKLLIARDDERAESTAPTLERVERLASILRELEDAPHSEQLLVLPAAATDVLSALASLRVGPAPAGLADEVGCTWNMLESHWAVSQTTHDFEAAVVELLAPAREDDVTLSELVKRAREEQERRETICQLADLLDELATTGPGLSPAANATTEPDQGGLR